MCEDIIKYMFFVFGNSMMIESFIKPLKKIIDYEKEYERDITLNEYKIIMNDFILNLSKTIPLVLKIILKLVYNMVKKFFSIDENNYGPLYTLLFFNFFINPKVQIIYSINSVKSVFIRSLNKLIYATIYNSKIKEEKFNNYNEFIEIYHKQIQIFIFENIIELNIDDDKIKKSLSDIFTEQFLIYPEFLIYKDTEFLCNTIFKTKKE